MATLKPLSRSASASMFWIVGIVLDEQDARAGLARRLAVAGPLEAHGAWPAVVMPNSPKQREHKRLRSAAQRRG